MGSSQVPEGLPENLGAEARGRPAEESLGIRFGGGNECPVRVPGSGKASPATPGLEPDSNRRGGNEAGRPLSKGGCQELRLGGTRSDLHFLNKWMTPSRVQGKGCKWEVRLAAVDGLIPPGDPQGLEVGAREKRAKPRETTRIKKPGFVLS